MPPFFSDVDQKVAEDEILLLKDKNDSLESMDGKEVSTSVNEESVAGNASNDEKAKVQEETDRHVHQTSEPHGEIIVDEKGLTQEERSQSSESIWSREDVKSPPIKNEAKARVERVVKQLMADQSEDSASDYDVEQEAHLVAHKSLRPRLTDRIPKADRRMHQSLLYTALVEDRLKALEDSIKELQNQDDSSSDSEDEGHTTNPHHTPDIRYLKWADFQKQPYIYEHRRPYIHGPGDTTPGSVLEVLIEEPDINSRHRFRARKQEDYASPSQVASDDNIQSSVHDTDAPEMHQRPIRLRIRSSLLVGMLNRLSPEMGLGDFYRSTITFFNPFKYLVTRADRIKELLQDLEVLHREKSVEPDAPTPQLDHTNLSDREERKPENTTAESADGGSTSSSKGNSSDDDESVGETNSYEALEHLRVLVKFIDNDLRYIWELREKLKQGTLRKIAFKDLWHLFDYGQEVRSSQDKEMQIYRVIFFTGGRELEDPLRPPSDQVAAKKFPVFSGKGFFVQCYHLDFNGTQYGPRDKLFMIKRYEGLKDINSLPCYPLTCDPNAIESRRRLLERGEEFARLSAQNNSLYRHKNYVGLTVDNHQEQVDSQVIVDFRWAFLKTPDWKPELGFSRSIEHDSRELYGPLIQLGHCGRRGCCGNDWVHWDFNVDGYIQLKYQSENRHLWEPIENAEDFDDDEKVLLPPRAFGFVLRSRKWATFAIDRLTNVTYNDGWSNLELPKGHKETVLALVQNHAGSPTQQKPGLDAFATMDLVRGKGKGLIILLHGEPGVGKTSTAECVADHTRRPLFPITCGDIGDNAEKVEDNLENNFQLAHRWGCVLLLDEADVFLQKRNKQDLARNSIVSVFLRTLEYYSGILFLTTNRVGAIDQAFKSRIHLSLLYPRLDRHTTVAIWKNHLTRIQKQVKAEKRKLEIDKKDIISYARTHFKELEELRVAPWNGRQIRNAFQTAMALAEYEAGGSTPRLNREQFQKVAELSKHFDYYLKEVWGGKNDADISRMDQVRMDTLSTEDLRHITTPKSKQRAQPTPGLKRVSTASILASKKEQLREEIESEHSSDEDDFSSEEEESESASESDEVDEEIPPRPVSPPPEAEASGERSRRKSKLVREKREESPVSKKSSRLVRR